MFPSNFLTAFLLTSVIHYNPSPTFTKRPPTQLVFIVKENVYMAQVNSAASAQTPHDPHCADILFPSFGEIIMYTENRSWQTMPEAHLLRQIVLYFLAQ